MIPTLNPLTPGAPHANRKEVATDLVYVPDRGRNSEAVSGGRRCWGGVLVCAPYLMLVASVVHQLSLK